MKHQTTISFPLGMPTPRVAGIRLHIDGMAWCLLELVIGGERVWHGGPVEDSRLTPIIHDPYSVHRTYFRFHSSRGEQCYYLRMPAFPTAIILHHESASGAEYTIRDFAPLAVSPDDFIDITPRPRTRRYHLPYKPSRIAHSTPHNFAPRMP